MTEKSTFRLVQCQFQGVFECYIFIFFSYSKRVTDKLTVRKVTLNSTSCSGYSPPLISSSEFLFLSFCPRPLRMFLGVRIMLFPSSSLSSLLTCLPSLLLKPVFLKCIHESLSHVMHCWRNWGCLFWKIHTMNTFSWGTTFFQILRELRGEMCTDHLKMATFYRIDRSWLGSRPLPYNAWCCYLNAIYISCSISSLKAGAMF